jgi:exopolysaccharide production protein ExoZ
MAHSLLTRCRRTMASLFFLDPSASRNPAMEGLRALAVIMVFLVHGIGTYMSAAHQINFNKYLPEVVPTITELDTVDKVLMIVHRSHSGVDLFFLLSGFLICRTALRIDGVKSYGRFMGRRWLRIYPAFFVSLLVCVVLYCWVFHFLRFNFKTFIANALILYGCPYPSISPYNYVTWSLFWEMSFYVIFPIQIMLTRRAFLGKAQPDVLAATLLLAVSCLFMAFQPRTVMFFYGALLALASQEQLQAMAARLPAIFVVALYVAVDMIFRLLPTSFSWYSPLYGMAATLFFVKVCFGQGWLTRLFSAVPLRWLGNISYSFYLMHAVCIWLAWQIGLRTGWPSNSLVALGCFLCLSLILSLVSSAALFLVCERWYFVKMHKKPVVQPDATPSPAYAAQRAA